MYYSDKGIVLRHRDINEADRIVTIFSYEYGRIEVNFKSVKKSKAKLRALSELFVYGDYRFYLKKYGAMPLCIGGSVISAYPDIREELEKIILLSTASDMVISLTPLYQKSVEKFFLILNSLNYISTIKKVSKWFFPVFILNLLEHYGTGFKNTNVGYNSEFWEMIHKPDYSSIAYLNKYDDLYLEVMDFAISKISENTNKKYFLDFIGSAEVGSVH